MPLGQRFDAQKAIEAILYVAQHVEQPTFHRISKILYFADKHKLAKYGGLVVPDEYVAMKNGPVPSCVYDLLKCVRGDRRNPAEDQARAAFQVVGGKTVVPLRESNVRKLTKADLECLDFSVGEFGRLSFDELTRLSHDAAWTAADEDDFMSLEDIARTTSSPDTALAAVRDPFTRTG